MNPDTPDGRYFVVRGRLWRRANPGLDDAERHRLVLALMAARRAKRDGLRHGDADAIAAARAAVDAAKRGLGERGPVWWDDGAPDYNRHLARNTPYAAWFAALPSSAGEAARNPERGDAFNLLPDGGTTMSDKHEQALDLTEEALEKLKEGDQAAADALVEQAKALDKTAPEEVLHDLEEDASNHD